MKKKFMIVFLFWFFQSLAAEAYLDPGFGNAIFQYIVLGLTSAAIFLQLFWFRIRVWFSQRFRSKNVKDSEEDIKDPNDSTKTK
jgi:hypothetical protein